MASQFNHLRYLMYAFISSQNAMLGDIFKPHTHRLYCKGLGMGTKCLKMSILVVKLSEIILASVVWSILKASDAYLNQILRPRAYFIKNSHKEELKNFSMFLYMKKWSNLSDLHKHCLAPFGTTSPKFFHQAFEWNKIPR